MATAPAIVAWSEGKLKSAERPTSTSTRGSDADFYRLIRLTVAYDHEARDAEASATLPVGGQIGVEGRDRCPRRRTTPQCFRAS
jgi:hypothetical protein